MGNSTGSADKKNLQKQTKMIKQRKDAGTCRDKKEKAIQEKITIQLGEINQKALEKEERLKKYRQRVKQYRQNKTFKNNERKFYQQLGGGDMKTYQQPVARETDRFWTKIWQPKNIINPPKKRTCKIVDFAVPAGHRLKLKESEKKDKYLDFARELKRLWNMKVTIIPIVIGAFDTVTKRLLKGLKDLEVGGRVEILKLQHF